MSRIDALRARLARATELGVPSDDFLRHEFEESRMLKSHLNARLAQAGQETEDALRELQQEVDSPEEAFMRLAKRQAYGDD
ncbi:MAG: hypothetical protein K8R60_19900 [Burkholderiales bacterium]|nr:hypothetical protein [Burkholderiales bacterium]